MNNTLTPMLGRELTDDELTAFHGGEGCTVTIRYYSNSTTVTTSGNCENVNINVTVKE